MPSLALIGTVAAVISAIGVLAVGVDWWRRREQRRERDAREREVSSAVGAMDGKVERLAAVVEALAEEAQARRPQITVRFLTNDGPSPSVVAVKRAIPRADLDAILASEREAALASLLPISGAEVEAPQTGIFGLGGIAGAGFGRGITDNARFLPVTQKDHDDYNTQVERYLRDLRKFVTAWLAYLTERQHSLRLRAQIDNDGGAPADQARLRLHFPDPCTRLADWPEKPEDLTVRNFERPERSSWAGGYGRELLSLSTVPSRITPVNLGTRSGPFYEDGSVRVRFEYEAIPHHDPLPTEEFIVGVPEPGVFKVEWTLGAANLARPESGVLHLEVRHEEPEPEPVRTLAVLLNAGRDISPPDTQ